MRKSVLVFSIILIAGLFACKKNDPNSPNFINLTNHIWQSDSLLANGEEAGGPGQMLEKFNGDAIFNKDGTGVFGQYEGGISHSRKPELLFLLIHSRFQI